MSTAERISSVPDRDVSAWSSLVAEPKEGPPDSFTLHAPLELIARLRLLDLVESDSVEDARDRLATLASTYSAAGASPGPAGNIKAADGAAARNALARAIADGDVELADAAASWLAERCDGPTIAALLADTVVPSLAGAAHASILLDQWRRSPRGALPGAPGLRSFSRELARNPGWRLTWFEDRPRTGVGTGDLIERLRRPRPAGDPGSAFVHPVMHLTESSGLASEVLADPLDGIEVGAATAQLLRVAAWSMLQDDPVSAPYGWSHCLTLPQAVLGLAPMCGDPGDATAIAATYVLGFRSLLGTREIDPGWAPDDTDRAVADIWHAPEDLVAPMVGRLATFAACHPDAHLAKYTVACLDASTADPAAGRLYLAAAAFLGAWWRQ